MTSMMRINYKGWMVIAIMTFAVLISYKISKAETISEPVFSSTEDAIYQTLIENGYSVAGACGILGNISVENPEFEPDLLANHGNTYGLFQWTDVGERKSTLTKWCNNRCLYPNSVEGQLAFAMYEMQGGDPQASRLNSYLQHADMPENAAMEFTAGFERCVGSTSNPDADGIYNGVLYPEFEGRVYQALSRRMENARRYYEGYKGKSFGQETALEIKIVPTTGVVAEKEAEMERRLLILIPQVETEKTGLLWLYRILCVVIGYLFGCILGISLIIRNVRKKEALHMEHKLPSLLTVLNHVGKKEFVLSTLIDILKMYAALLVMYFITKGALGSEQILLVGIGVILGNAFPFWRKFSGGMGLIVTAVFICTYMPIWGYICCLTGLIIAIIVKSLPFGAISLCVIAIPYAFFCKGVEGGIFITLAVVILLYKHYRFLKKFVGHELLHKHYGHGHFDVTQNPAVNRI